jgi:hypothetical protein
MLQLVWDFLGGEPVELQIEEVKDEVRNIQSCMALLSDLVSGNIGIERIWPDRATWVADSADGLRTWQQRVCQAKTVNMMHKTLWTNWMHQGEFRRRLFKGIARGTVVRILIYDPDSAVLDRQIRDERNVPGLIQQEVKTTLLRVAEGWNDLPVSAKKNLEVRLTKALHLAQVILADERMIVVIYLSGKSGNSCPVLQPKGPLSSYFRKYLEQFEILWRLAKPLNEEQFGRILQRGRPIPAAPDLAMCDQEDC